MQYRPQRIQFANWGANEYWAALRSLLTGAISAGPNVVRLEAELAAQYTPSIPLTLNAGRTALRIALTAFSMRHPERRQVLLPAYLCPSVIDTVRSMGLEPIPVPVGADLNIDPDRLNIDGNVLAVLAAHMYACPAKIAQIEQRCKAAGVFLIDDAAQVAGVSCDGRQLGTFGDVGILSFAQSKTLVAGVRGAGGVLLINNRELEFDLRRLVSALPHASHRATAFFFFITDYLLANHAGRAAYYISRIAHKLFVSRKQDPYTPALMSNLEAGIILAQLRRLPQILSARISVAQRYAQALCNIPGVTIPQYAAGRFLSRVFMKFEGNVGVKQIQKYLSDERIASRVAYPVWSHAQRDNKNNENFDRLLELPSRSDMSDSDVARVVSVIIASANI